MTTPAKSRDNTQKLQKAQKQEEERLSLRHKGQASQFLEGTEVQTPNPIQEPNPGTIQDLQEKEAGSPARESSNSPHKYPPVMPTSSAYPDTSDNPDPIENLSSKQ